MVAVKTKNTSVKPKEKKEIVQSVEWSIDGMLLQTFALITCVKVLLIPTYYSTDFEVHRNWLAITYSLPVKEWYVNAYSQWTLDYPPLFAWFEYFLSQFAVWFDPAMLDIENQNYASSMTVMFQRFTVMFADLMLVYGVREISKVFCKSYESSFVFVFMTLCNMGLLVVDHIHFQYNGILLGILLLSLAKVCEINNGISVIQGAMWFAILLNLKHIYLYVAPAFVVWLLKSYCLKDSKFFKRFFLLATTVSFVLALSFGPFIHQLPQIMSRLFPFKRGLVHAYWAANGWALYIAGEKLLLLISKYFGWLQITKSAVMTGGLVQEQSFAILPTPTPLVTFILTSVSLIPLLWSLIRKKESDVDSRHFIRCVVLCALNSFMFGWHVHEKAILTAIIPLCVLAVEEKNDARIFTILSTTGHTALLPLLYPENLVPLKILLLLSHITCCILCLSRQYGWHFLRLYEWLYVFTLPFLTIYETMLHTLIFGDKLPFLPLAFTSIYCAIGITYCWLLYYYMFLTDPDESDEEGKPKGK